jgi:ribonuclease Z
MKTLFATALLACALLGSAARAADMTVTLLGTGTPIPEPDRFGPSTLVQAGGLNLLFDAGRGAPIRLAQINVLTGQIDALFLTHLHSDHVNGLPDVWLTGYLPIGGRKGALHVYGPEGTADLARGLVAAYAEDQRLRLRTTPDAKPDMEIDAREFSAEGPVFEKNGVKVIAFPVDHGPGLKAFGFEIDFGGRKVVLSGDTKLNDNVIKHATGADLLVHEVFVVPPALKDTPIVAAIQRVHVTPQQAGMVFSQARPKLAVYSHIGLFSTPKVPPVAVDEIGHQTRETYAGPFEIGRDLMRVTVGDAVTVRNFDANRNGYGD